MFYTKYRPQKFSEISKPNAVATAVQNQVKSNKVGHAYLFIGPRGTGKTTTARILAKALNCKDLDKNGDPCARCATCIQIANGSFLDLIEIDAASNRGIDDIRDLREKIKLAPTSGKQKVYIVDEVHMLTTEAFNALLKTLEEPPSHATFILCTTEAHKVPDTIKSRCQVFNFKRATIAQLTERLANITKQEKAKISKEDLKKIAAASFGGFRDAETLLQQVIEGSLDVDSLIGTTNINDFITFTDHIIAKDLHACLNFINDLYQKGVDLHVWNIEYIKYLRELLFVSVGCHDGIIDATEENLQSMTNQAKSLKSNDIVQIINPLNKARNNIKSSIITQLPLEIALVNLLSTHQSNFFEKSNLNLPKNPNSSQNSSAKGSKFTNNSTKNANSLKSNDTNDKSSKADSSKNSSANLNATTKAINVKTLETNVQSNIDSSVGEGVQDNTAHIEVSAEVDVNLDRPVVTAEALSEELSEALENQLEEALHDIEDIKTNWKRVQKVAGKHNQSVKALLMSAKPTHVQSNTVVLEVAYSFHKERLESSKNKNVVEAVLQEVFEKELTLSCVLGEKPAKKTAKSGLSGDLTDRNVAVPADAPIEIDDNLLGMFDGGLPAV